MIKQIKTFFKKKLVSVNPITFLANVLSIFIGFYILAIMIRTIYRIDTEHLIYFSNWKFVDMAFFLLFLTLAIASIISPAFEKSKCRHRFVIGKDKFKKDNPSGLVDHRTWYYLITTLSFYFVVFYLLLGAFIFNVVDIYFSETHEDARHLLKSICFTSFLVAMFFCKNA